MPNVTFPVGGINRDTGFQTQAPYTTVDAFNVRPIDVFDKRGRGGVRPGLAKYYGSAFGSGNPILAGVRMMNSSGVAINAVLAGGTIRFESSPGSIHATSISGMNTAGRVCTAVMGDKWFLAQAGLASPYYFDAVNSNGGSHGNAVIDEPTLGIVPTNCDVVMSFLDRLYFAGNTSARRAYYASAIGDPNNYLYSGTGTSRAFTSSYNVGGANNDILRAMIPWTNDTALFMGRSSCGILYGDPLNGGYFRTLSQTVGILDPMAWCRGPGNEIFTVSRSGLAVNQPGARGEPELLSNKKLRQELMNIDPATYHVVPVWDQRAQGINIFISKVSAASNVDHWFYDLRMGAFYRDQFPSTSYEPFSAWQYPELSQTGSSTLIGCRDGYIRYFSDSQATDDGTNFNSHVYLGPFRVGSRDFNDDGIVSRIIGKLATSSGAANWALYVGDTPDAAYANAVAGTAWASGTLAAGYNTTNTPEARCAWCYLKVYGTAGTRWALESMLLEFDSGDYHRVT